MLSSFNSLSSLFTHHSLLLLLLPLLLLGKSSELNSTNTITSVNGKEFLQFGKSRSWARDLYEDYVAYEYDADLYVETWRSGTGGR